MQKKKIALIGATGSIGNSALDVIRKYPDKFEVVLMAGGCNWQALAALAVEFNPQSITISSESGYAELKRELSGTAIQLGAGESGLDELLAGCGADLCISAAAGTHGLKPTISALRLGMDVALANKESLVAAGGIVMRLARENNCLILPLDSEHSAIMQCLEGNKSTEDIARIVITSSGGAVRDIPIETLAAVTPQQALCHPNWSMGRKITIDSATLANKALEVMEAHWLFDLPYEIIDVLVHRQSIVHGMVEFTDSSVMAQLAVADMKLPICWALNYPERLECGTRRLSLKDITSLSFDEVDNTRYPLLGLGYESGKRGGIYPAVYSAANEAAVEMFLDEKIPFGRICPLVEAALENAQSVDLTLDNIYASEEQARRIVAEKALAGCLK